MVTLYYRGMAQENGKPKIGQSARLLGVRPGTDIDIEQVPEAWLDTQKYLKPDLEQRIKQVSLSVLTKLWKREFDVDLSGHATNDEVRWLLSQGYWNVNSDLVTVVVRNTKGMSTSLSIEGLPRHRRPEAFGGTGREPLWQIDSDKIAGDLEAIQDGQTHVSIMPRATMLLERYESALANTQDDWQSVECNPWK